MDAAVERLEGLARAGVFGQGDVVRVVANSEDGKGAQYASQLFFVRVDLKTDVVTEVPVVVKVQPHGDMREIMGTDIQFANEVTMYQKVLPKLGTTEQGMTCKMLHGRATVGENPDEDIIIFEDLRPFGYKVSKNVFIDHHHALLTLRKLGEYHGLSYKLKKSSPNTVKDLAIELLPPRFTDDGGEFFKGALLRGFKPLVDKQPNGMANKAHEKLSSVPLSELWKFLKKPVEPFAVIIHGDFNVNNLLFAYDENEKPTNVKFVDFGTSMYSDPAVDISFFLYMNTSAETRDEYWGEFLRTYWEGVLSVEAEPGFVFEEFLDHFARRAIWGYIPCCFFLPMMLFPEESSAPPADFLKLTEEEKKAWEEKAMAIGGEKATQATSNIVHHLLDKGYLEQFVDNLDFTL